MNLHQWIDCACATALGLMLTTAGLRSSIGDELAGFDCLIEPHAVIELSTREEGILEELFVDRGDEIAKGQAIARLESSIEEATVNLARVRANMEAELEERRLTLKFARREMARLDELHKKHAVPSSEQDRATTEAARAALQLRQVEQQQRAAELELERAEQSLNLRTIHSPVAGVVVERLLAIGESVEDRPIVKVAEVDPLNVEIIIPARLFTAVRPGMRAEVKPLLPGAEVHTAKVTIVDRLIDAASNTFGVRLELPNPENKIPGGVRCEIRFIDGSHQQLGELPLNNR